MSQDMGMFTVAHTVGTVLCCKCGVLIHPNAANMCAICLSSEVDITEGIQKRLTIRHCAKCDAYLQPPRNWIKAKLESNRLRSFCLNRLKNLNKVRLDHAEFVHTEPHSKRILLKLKVKKEVLSGTVLEKVFTVEYVVLDQTCESCTRFEANPDQWVAVVQLRQHASHRRTFFYLEQLILKHDAAKHAIRIKQTDHGLDFFFNNRNHAVKFIEFVANVSPTKSRNDKQLISHDRKSNNYNYKYTFSVEICPLCREDLICLPPKVSTGLGKFGPLVICHKVSNSVALLDPSTLRQSFLSADQYWGSPFKSLLSSRHLVEYEVLDIELTSSEINVGGSKYVFADAEVVRVSDFGKNDTKFKVRTHLGRLLNPGDNALGYDLYGANGNDIELDKYKGLVIPDVILIKKSYEEKRRGKQGEPRPWKLKSLDMEVDESVRGRGGNIEKMSTEYEQFLRDLEENPDLRFNLSLYRDDKVYEASGMASVNDDGDLPRVPLEELLADLDISCEEDDHGEDDDDDDDRMRE